jgi:hypothetical protein
VNFQSKIFDLVLKYRHQKVDLSNRVSIGGVDFWIFWIFDLLRRNLDWQKNSKTFLCRNEFSPKKVKKAMNRVNNFLLQIGRYGYQKIRNFTLISK